MFMPDRWIVLKIRFEGPFVLIGFLAPDSKLKTFSALWENGTALAFKNELSDLRELVLKEAARLPSQREGPHAISPVPIPLFLDFPVGVEQRLYEYVAASLVNLGAPLRFQLVLLHRGTWIRRRLLRLPIRIQTVGTAAETISWTIRSAGWYLGRPTVEKFGIRFTSGDTYTADQDIVIGNTSGIMRSIAARPLAHRPRLVLNWGTSLPDQVPQVPSGVALCEIEGDESSVVAAVYQLIFGLIHDFPLHEAVASSQRTTPTRQRLIADPRSNQSLRILDALESAKREGIRWETKLGPVFTAAANKMKFPEEIVERAAGHIRSFVGDFKNFERETHGLEPLADLESNIANWRSQADRVISPLRLSRRRVFSLRESQNRSVDAALERLETEPLLQSLPKNSTLKSAARYQLRLHIGNRLVDSIVAGKIPSIDPLLSDPEDARGHELEFLLQPKDFDVLSRRAQRFYLPLAGSSDPVYFTIRAPLQALDAASLRILLYYRNHIVQSFLLTAEIAEEERGSNSPESLKVSLEFTRTKRFTNLDELGPRRLSIAINQGPNATHDVSFKGTKVDEGKVRLDPYTFDDKLIALRKSLKEATAEPSDPTIARAYPQVNDGDLAPAMAADVLRDLAIKGKELYDALFDRAAAQNEKLRSDLVDVSKTEDKRLQVVRYDLDYVFPWTILYDYKLPRDRRQAAFCLGRLRSTNGDITPCGHKSDSGVYCVRGFWGIRHQVEELLGKGSLTDSHVSLPTKLAAIRIVADQELPQAKELEKGLTGEVGKNAVTAEPIDEEELITLLWKIPPERPALLIVLGHMEEQDERIRLVRDQKWLSRAELADRAHEEREAWNQPRSVVLLMACDSAAGTLKTVNNFVIAFNTAGAAAIVGTECIVDSKLAAEFAQEISIAMLKDKVRLGAAITKFRRTSLQRGNPLAFVFNAIGDVDLRIQ